MVLCCVVRSFDKLDMPVKIVFQQKLLVTTHLITLAACIAECLSGHGGFSPRFLALFQLVLQGKGVSYH